MFKHATRHMKCQLDQYTIKSFKLEVKSRVSGEFCPTALDTVALDCYGENPIRLVSAKRFGKPVRAGWTATPGHSASPHAHASWVTVFYVSRGYSQSHIGHFSAGRRFFEGMAAYFPSGVRRLWESPRRCEERHGRSTFIQWACACAPTRR